jgi:hypothetical protein
MRVDTFETHRPSLLALAYRMLGDVFVQIDPQRLRHLGRVN